MAIAGVAAGQRAERLMTRTVILAVGVAVIAASATRAADLYGGEPYYAPAPYAAAPVAARNWAGPYLGANLGYQFANTTVFGIEPNGLVGGVQGGYNWQFDQVVIGGEADFQFSGAEETFARYKFSNPWFGTARARLGYALNNILFYGTAGLAFGQGQLEYLGASKRHTHAGWTAGAGMEVGLTPNWSARAEYLYVDLSDVNYVLAGMNTGIESNILRFGLNYRF